jgi:uncharacterized protein
VGSKGRGSRGIPRASTGPDLRDHVIGAEAGRWLGWDLRVKTNRAGERLLPVTQGSTWPKHRSPGAGEGEESSVTYLRSALKRKTRRRQEAVLIRDTLVVKEGDTFIVYSPFKGNIARVVSFPEEGSTLYDRLRERGFFQDVPALTQPDTKWAGFTSLALLLTRKCNLACSYCYASALPIGDSMPTELAIDSLDWFVGQLQQPTIRITFHGGGEPTLEWTTIRAVVGRTELIRHERKASYLITTNGTCGPDKWDWMMAHHFGISISMDGPPQIQDRNRPWADGTGSSQRVEASVRYLAAHSYPFSIRVTYSPVDDIERILEYFAELGVRRLHLEPLFPHGREYQAVRFGKHGGDEVYSPEGSELLLRFLRAMDRARALGIRINNGHLAHFTRGKGYFCGAASARAMVVSHDGFLTGCLEVVDGKDRDAKTFLLGRYIRGERRFEVDPQMVRMMQRRHADFLLQCKTCYARYTCAGGCAVKVVRASGDFFERDIPYCSFTKGLVAHLVRRIAETSGV